MITNVRTEVLFADQRSLFTGTQLFANDAISRTNPIIKFCFSFVTPKRLRRTLGKHDHSLANTTTYVSGKSNESRLKTLPSFILKDEGPSHHDSGPSAPRAMLVCFPPRPDPHRDGSGPAPTSFLKSSITSRSRGISLIALSWSSGKSGVGSSPVSFLYSRKNSGS
jgi:hypothetical protein